MTNTTNNVPRELLERCAQYTPTLEKQEDRARALSELRAMLSAPSPAGVDGLEVAAYLIGGEPSLTPCRVRGVVNEPLCRLPDAQAIIDGLLGENERIRLNIAEYNESIACYQSERDQQAQRIGELEAALEFACKSLAQVTSSDGSGHADIAVSVIRMAGRKEADASQIVESYKAGAKWRIDAALSAGKEKQDEHN